MFTAHHRYVGAVFSSFRSLKLPIGADEFEALLLYQRLYEAASPLFILSDFDPARLEGYDALLRRWAYDIWRHRRGPKLVTALRRSARRFARRGLDYVVIVGLLHQLALSLIATKDVGYAAQPAGKAD